MQQSEALIKCLPSIAGAKPPKYAFDGSGRGLHRSEDYLLRRMTLRTIIATVGTTTNASSDQGPATG